MTLLMSSSSDTQPSPAPIDAAPPAASPPGEQAPAATQPKPERPAYVPESFWDGEAGVVKAADFSRHIEELAGAKSKLDERMSAIPADAKEYAIELPDDIKLPDGVSINPDDPKLAAAREMAKELGLTKGEFNRLAALEIKHQLQERAAIEAYRAAEMQKLGPQAASRVEAVTTAIVGRVGADAAKHIIPLLVGSQQVAAFEQLLKSGGSVPFTQYGRADVDPNSIPGFEKMTTAQRLAAIDARKAS